MFDSAVESDFILKHLDAVLMMKYELRGRKILYTWNIISQPHL